MLRSSILEISSRRILRTNPRRFITQQIPSHLSSRKNLSSVSKPGGASPPGSTGKPPESNGSLSKFFIGSVAVGAAFLAAYQTGYLNQYLKKEHRSVPEEPQVNATNGNSESIQHSVDQLIPRSIEKINNENPAVEDAEQKIDTYFTLPENATDDQGDKVIQVQDESNNAEDGIAAAKENQLPEYPQSSQSFDDPSRESVVQFGGVVGIKSTETDTDPRPEMGIQHISAPTQTSAVPEDNGLKNIQPTPQEIDDKREDLLAKDIEQQPTLLESYHLKNKSEGSPATYLYGHGFTETNVSLEEKKALSGALEELNDGYISKDGKLVLDFLQAIHAAEKRQADLDAHVFNEEKKVLKEKYEKKLKDAAARELMLAEETAMLDKELKRERAKAALAIKTLQEKMEEKLKTELEQKESEAEMKLRTIQELAKAELNATIANEKASQIEKMAEANVNINALCMAFYAQSEEAHQSNAAQNFALGALALENALSKGLPIQTEIASLQCNLEGIDKDSVLDLVLASLPEETRTNGTDTQLQLKQKFDSLKGTVRQFIFVPPGGGGILAHSLAHIASWLKVREDEQSGDGIESVINKVESYLAEGKLVEAADFLEESVRGTKAAESVAGWAKQARNRAISEQAVVLLQSYATSINLT
ncbi:putative mitochondrial inner membrane protein Mitofilin [Lupinus albus]|uniref:Putative mitochondrial inner membrane protein Mitofilin n=1 Tax=Lupinus albus TaxID=3870 RepID=A0A6A4Q8M3_LUPAL|nr:putative mitochondrial inner membrane protein Mitofilin [Lupinus albus]